MLTAEDSPLQEMQAQQRAAANQAAVAPADPAAPVPLSGPTEVDSKKRKADGEAGSPEEQEAGIKRTRFDDENTQGGSSKQTRDREHCTVFVAGLAPGTSEKSIKNRFIDVSLLLAHHAEFPH